ncbi:MAG TPA: hypothetical protein VGN69_10290 [Solirubrobacteraceae bacterium]|nr:hypothetical protein [Solirubrobacteraceae bacterium]
MLIDPSASVPLVPASSPAGTSPVAPGAEGGALRQGVAAAGLLTIAVGLANALNVGFHLIVARLIGVEEYSLLGTLLGVMMILIVPTLALQAVVARQVARDLQTVGPAAAGATLRTWYRTLTRASLAGIVVLALVSVPIAAAVHTSRFVPIGTTLLAVAAGLALPVSWGGLQGIQRFRALAFSQILFSALKLGAGVVLALVGLHATAIMLGIAAAGLLTLGASLLPLGELLSAAGRGVRTRSRLLLTRATVGSVASLTTLTALTMSDLLVARIAFSPHISGAYNAASISARLLLVLPIAVTAVLLPRVAVLDDVRLERRLLVLGLAAVGAASAAVVGVFYALPHLLISLGFGTGYEAAESWLGPLGLAMAGYALVNVYAYQLLAVGRSGVYALVLAGTLLVQVAGFGFFHGRPEDLIAVQVVTAGLLLVVSEVAELLLVRRRDMTAPEAGV